MKVLVTGATGYVGGRLVPRLLESGHEVRTTTTNPDKPAPWWSDRVETVRMDIADAADVDAALAGMDAVYYLVHGMGGGDDFAEKDRRAATNVARAVEAHGTSRVVYLSGIVPPADPDELSAHITSRHEVEQILAATPATTLTLRAAVLMGSGSTSFEIIRQVSERMPVQTVPTWMNSDVQPIAVVDAIEALLGALTAPVSTRSYDIGGPERMPYGDLLDRYTDITGLERPQVEVPFLPTDLVGTLVGALTDVPSSTVQALVESLHHDMVCAEEDFRADLLPTGYHLMGLDEAIRRSLADPRTEVPEDPESADPMGPMPQDPSWASGGDDQPLLAKASDAVRGVVEQVLPGRGSDRG
ncbi:NAD(P)H-binding protein [Agilicoccus flavus]|uniref:NAD(P)H-binding protein n=1 Tax=Agilicoccus flavus TaxID=2775968 RepID=UPI001CF6A5D7|nr:NAD(P)H-binding protein [Agilicoccus flavus]